MVATVDPQSASLKLTSDKGLPLSIWTLPLIVPDPDGEVQNPTMLELSLPRVLHEISVTEVVILTLKVVVALKTARRSYGKGCVIIRSHWGG